MLEVSVLGPLQVVDGGDDVTPAGDLQRRLLCALLCEAGRPLSPDRLADELWGEQLPSNHVAALQTQVSRLRKRLPALRLERGPAGYAVHLDGAALDAERFERATTEAFARMDAEPTAALAQLDDALTWWRGDPYAELATHTGDVARTRLVELRLRAIDERTELLLAAGRGAELVGPLEAAALEHPTRERTHVQLVRALAATGRGVDAMRAYDRFRRTLADDLGVEPSAEFQALHADLLVGGAEGDLAPRRRVADVPRYPTAIVARHDEIAEVSRLVGAQRLVTVVGTGGVGKTRLAAEVATRLAPSFEAGAAWCDLASSSPADVLESVATQLGVQTRGGEPTIDRLINGLGRAPMLVVLDNCEHVIDEAAALAHRVLAGTDGIHLLATSRERLAIDGEHLVTLAPLPVERRGGESAAVDLFLQRAAATGAHLPDEPRTRALLVELCRRLGGLPLAIELAAAQLHSLDLEVVADEIGQGLDLLSGQRTADRHRSLAVAMQWSYDLLSPDEQTTFSTLATFRAGFDVEGAAAVLACPAPVAARRIRALVERSMLQRGDGGWSMLEPLRQFAEEVRAASWTPDAAAEVEDRHAEHLVARAEQLNAALRGDDPASAFLAFDRELPDMRAAHTHLVARRDAERLFRLGYAVRDFGIWRPRAEVLTWARTAAAVAPDDERAADMLAFSGFGDWSHGDRAGFGDAVARAQALSERLRGPGAESVDVASALGLYALADGRPTDASRWYEHAAQRAEVDSADDPVRRCVLQVMYVVSLGYAGDPSTPRAAEALLDAFSASASPLTAAWAWYGAGEAELDRDPELALSRLERSADLAVTTEALRVAATCGASLASHAVRSGDVAKAVHAYRWLLPFWRRSGDTSIVWTAMRSIAALLELLGDPARAAAVLGAVRATPEGHQVYGSDHDRLAALEARLEGALGDGFASAVAAARSLDVTELSDLVLEALDDLVPTEGDEDPARPPPAA